MIISHFENPGVHYIGHTGYRSIWRLDITYRVTISDGTSVTTSLGGLRWAQLKELTLCDFDTDNPGRIVLDVDDCD
ncbi:MAG: hypothetical protein OXH84_03425 [Gammaproteobacteria bacterium]|nr:hypothetical protein [Gammaproteobacteria bacterium]